MEVSIDITFIGAIIIPLTLTIFILRPIYLLPLLIAVSVLHGASVLNGTIADFQFGVPPYYYVAIWIAIRYVIMVVSKRQSLLLHESSIRTIILLLVVLWLWSILSSFLFPYIFRDLEVYCPRGGLDAQYEQQTPLKWTFSNLAQAIYLTLNFVVVLYTISAHTNHSICSIMISIGIAIAIVCIVGTFQIMFLYVKLQFPYWIFNSNIVYYQGYKQYIGSFRRVVSTFTEASCAGAFLASIESGFLSVFLQGLIRERQKLLLIITIFLVFDLLIRTMATTGYITFIFSVILLVYCYNPLRKRQNLKRWTVYIIGAILIIYAVDTLNPLFNEYMESTLVKDTKSESFIHRTASDIHAIKVFLSSYGIGVGLGSNRSSSLIATLLSTIGIIGASLFSAIVSFILVEMAKVRSQLSCNFVFWTFLSLLIAQCIAIPDISFPPTWAFLIVAMHLLCYKLK